MEDFISISPNNLEFEIKPNPERFPKEYMEKSLSSYSSFSNFDDDAWLIDKINLDENSNNKDRSIFFGGFKNKGILYETKEWAIKLLLQRYSTMTINHKVGFIRQCDKALNNVDSFAVATEKEILNIYSHVFSNQKVNLERNLQIWNGLKVMLKSLDYQKQYLMMEKYITQAYPDRKINDEKYIPDEVANQLDVIFQTREDIPTAYRTIYWTLRLIPNRIKEVLSMTINCLKPIDRDTFVLSIPSFKQSGRFKKGTIKLIEIKNEDFGEYYISLLQKQIEDATKTYKQDTNFLFYTYRYRFIKKKGTYYKFKSNLIQNINKDSVNEFFATLCKFYNFHDYEGNPIKVTTHQFRHNAISDRMNSGIFRAIDIKELTKHHNSKMIEESYTHTRKDDLIKDTPIVFKGRIINTDNDRKINQLLLKPYAKRIYKLGICSDVRSCYKDKSQCLRCDFMIPDTDNLEYYKKELIDWEKKKEKALKIGNIDFADLCQDWIDSYEIIIQKVLRVFTNEDVELIKKEIYDNGL